MIALRTPPTRMFWTLGLIQNAPNRMGSASTKVATTTGTNLSYSNFLLNAPRMLTVSLDSCLEDSSVMCLTFFIQEFGVKLH
jgi:hypothetical protein